MIIMLQSDCMYYTHTMLLWLELFPLIVVRHYYIVHVCCMGRYTCKALHIATMTA